MVEACRIRYGSRGQVSMSRFRHNDSIHLKLDIDKNILDKVYDIHVTNFSLDELAADGDGSLDRVSVHCLGGFV